MIAGRLLIFAIAVLLGNKCRAEEVKAELHLLVTSNHILLNDIVIARVAVENQGKAPLVFDQHFSGSTGIVHFERRIGEDQWEIVPCYFCGRLSSSDDEYKLETGKTYCTYETILGKGDRFVWNASGKHELKAVAKGRGFRVESLPIMIEVDGVSAWQRLPDRLSLSQVASKIGRSSPLSNQLGDRNTEWFRAESELRKNLDRDELFARWLKASGEERIVLDAKLRQIIESSDPVTSDRFSIGIAIQQLKRGDLAKSRDLLERLPHPSKASRQLQHELNRKRQPLSMPPSN